MPNTMREIMNPCLPTVGQPGFPNAPADWTRDQAIALAKADGIELGAEHWEVLLALQNYCARHQQVNTRELHDALDEKFHIQGGLKRLYELFPGGPIAQGCRLAGIEISQTVLDPT